MPPSPPDYNLPPVESLNSPSDETEQTRAAWTARPSGPASSLPRPQASLAEREQINRLLTNAGIQFRRGLTTEAEKTLNELLTLYPTDASAHELRGDICLTRGDFDGAIAAFKRALQSEPGRVTAEAKLARATLRQTEGRRQKQLGVAYAASDTAMVRIGGVGGDVKKTARLAIFGSALLPGLGQFVNGQPVKAGMIAAVYFLSLLGLVLSPDAQDFARQVSLLFVPSKLGKPDFSQVSGILWFFLLLNVADWIFAVVDAAITSSRATADAGAHDKDGWQV